MIQQVGVTLPETPPDRQHLLHVAFKKVTITTTIRASAAFHNSELLI